MQSTGAVSCRQTLPMIYPTGSPRRKPRATEMPDGSGSYDIGAQEAIAMAGIVGSADKIGQCLAQIIIDSSRHWLYVGSDEMKYTGVGVTCVDDLWYTCIMVTTTDEYEK